MKKQFQVKLYLICFVSLFIFLSTAMPVKAGVLVIAYMGESQVVLIGETELSSSPKVLTLSEDNRRAFLTNPDDNSVSVVDIVAGKQLTTFQTGKKPDGIGWVN